MGKKNYLYTLMLTYRHTHTIQSISSQTQTINPNTHTHLQKTSKALAVISKIQKSNLNKLPENRQKYEYEKSYRWTTEVKSVKIPKVVESGAPEG